MLLSVSDADPDDKKPWSFSRFRTESVRDLAGFVKVITKSVWSPIIWKDGIRKEENFLSCDMAVLDFDSPELSLANAVQNTFCDTSNIIGTTRSHQKEKHGITCDRYRVVLPWDIRCTDLSNYRYNMRLFYHNYPCDKCIDGARYFFPCKKLVSYVSSTEGEVTSLVAGQEITRKIYTPKFAAAGVLPNAARHALQILVKPGERNTFFYGVAKDMIKCGFARDKILLVMRNSKTYKDCWDDGLERELNGTIDSAERKVRSEQHG